MSTDFFIIDVSHWDPSVDWKTLKSHKILSAIVKVTDGYNGFNQLFNTHCDGAKAEGMVLGAYHFFRPDSTVLFQSIIPVNHKVIFVNDKLRNGGTL